MIQNTLSLCQRPEFLNIFKLYSNYGMQISTKYSAILVYSGGNNDHWSKSIKVNISTQLVNVTRKEGNIID